MSRMINKVEIQTTLSTKWKTPKWAPSVLSAELCVKFGM